MPRLSSPRPPIALAACLALLAGCNVSTYPDRPAAVLEDVAVSSIAFWPSSLRYARPGDTVAVRVAGLMRGSVCAEVERLGWDRLDSNGADVLTLRSRVRLPARPTCALEPAGLDTLLRETLATLAGKRLLVRAAGQAPGDTLTVLDGEAHVERFIHLVSAPDTAFVLGRYTFLDSGAARATRLLKADSMATCETFQWGTYRRSGDTVAVTFRRLIAAAGTPPESFPPCAGPRPDSVRLEPDVHGAP